MHENEVTRLLSEESVRMEMGQEAQNEITEAKRDMLHNMTNGLATDRKRSSHGAFVDAGR